MGETLDNASIDLRELGGLGASPWVDRLLNEHWDAIVAATPEGAIPEIAWVSARGKVTAREYGCGHYGCVMPTVDPNIVCKVTSDETEAFFVACVLKIGEQDAIDGLVRYLSIRAFPETSKHRERQTFIIWREAAHDIGPNTHWGIPHSDPYDRSNYRELQMLLAAFKEGANLVREAGKSFDKIKSKTRKEQLDEVVLLRDRAYDIAAEQLSYLPKFEAQLTKATRGSRAALKYAVGLEACRQAAEVLENTYRGDAMGSALGFYMEQGLLLADVHANNVGRVDRAFDDGQDYSPVVITDPGHAVVLDERWSTVTIEEL